MCPDYSVTDVPDRSLSVATQVPVVYVVCDSLEPWKEGCSIESVAIDGYGQIDDRLSGNDPAVKLWMCKNIPWQAMGGKQARLSRDSRGNVRGFVHHYALEIQW